MGDADADKPPRLFPKRLKGYFKCPVLSRVTVLNALKWVGKRGEFWSQWKDPSTGEDYDGSLVLAHGLFLYYMRNIEPTCTVTFDDKGHVNSTSEILKKIRKFVPCLFCAHVS